MKFPWRLILTAGVVAGTLDGLAASIQYYISTGKDPMNVFVYIASGVFGKAAFGGGWSMALWGVIFHYGIATIWSAAVFMLTGPIRKLLPHRVLRPVALGIAIWLAMNLIVLPLSNVPPITIRLDRAILGAAILIVCVAFPIDILVGRHIRSGTPTA